MEKSCGCRAATTTSSTRSTRPLERCGASRWAKSPTASPSGPSRVATRWGTRGICVSGSLVGCQSVTDAGLRQEVAGAGGLGLELVTQVGHVDADVVRLLGM